jgi:hypothetical protein
MSRRFMTALSVVVVLLSIGVLPAGLFGDGSA